MGSVSFILFFLASPAIFAGESLRISQVVNHPFTAVRPAVEICVAASRTNVVGGILMLEATALTNSTGAVGLRFPIFSCVFVPFHYYLEATVVDPSSTRLEVYASVGDKDEAPVMAGCMATSARILIDVVAAISATDLPIKISLGIRDNNALGLTELEYPLAFRIENTGKAFIPKLEVPSLFSKGIIHLVANDGKEHLTHFQKMWRTRIYDLPPGGTFESPVYGDLRSFFPAAQEGVYQVWWTLEGVKSNVLRFTVTSGKIIKE